MIINRRYKRDIRKNLAFYVSASVLTAVTIFLFLTIFTSGTRVKSAIADFFKSQKLENAEFVVMHKIDHKGELEEKYDLTINQQDYVDVEKKGKTIRLFCQSADINRYRVLEGKDITNNDEILLSRKFCKKNNIPIGSKYKLGDKKYVVCGYAARPDYLYALKEQTDSYPDPEKFGIGIMKRGALERFDDVASYYSVIYNNKNKVDAFLDELREKNTILSYVDEANNQRIHYANTSPESFIAMSVIVLPIMLLLVVFMISVVLERQIKQEKRIIGALYSLGYRRNQLKLFYAGYALLPGIFGGILGIIISVCALNTISGFISKNFEAIFGEIELIPAAVVFSLVGPTILYELIALRAAGKLLKIKPVVLLTGRDTGAGKKSQILKNATNIKFSRVFQFRILANNKLRTLAVLLGIILSGFVMELGFICNNSTEAFIDTSLEKTGNFDSIYYLNNYKTKEEIGHQEGYIYGVFKADDDETQFHLIGGEGDAGMLNLKNLQGEKIDLDSGYYITHIAAKLYGLKKGDKFHIRNNVTMKKSTVTITDIVDADVQKNLYTSCENARKVLDIDQKGYNMIVSSSKLNFAEDEILATTSKSSIRDQLNAVLESTNKMIKMMIVIGVIICIFLIYMTVNMIVDENRNNISMLKVLGYRKREINRTVLNVNNILIPIGLILSVPFSLIICQLFFQAMIKTFACYIKAVIDPRSIVICAMILVASYIFALQITKRKVYEINMVESLKDNR